MKTRLNGPIQIEYLTKVVLTAIFLSAFLLFVLWKTNSGQDLNEFHLSVLDLVLLAFATLRMGRLIAYDLVMEPFRSPFARTVPDETGAGESVEPKGAGVQRALGQLLSCPICAGTWASAVLVFSLYTWPGPARIFITVLGAIGIAEMLNALLEFLCWTGQQARTQTGMIMKSDPSRVNSVERDANRGSEQGG